MTDAQRITLQSKWWPAACRAQGWKPNDRELRLRVLSLALNFTFADVAEFKNVLDNYDKIRHLPIPGSDRPFIHLESANMMNSTSHVDAVKALLFMLDDDIAKADEHGKPHRGQGRRQQNVLEDKMLCLSQYPLDKPMGIVGARAFVQEILNDKFNHGRKYQHITIDDVDDRPRFVQNKRTGEIEERASQKEQLLMTISARLNGKDGFRAKAGHSVHDMLKGVGLPCNCAKCMRAAAITSLAPEMKSALLGVPAIPDPMLEQDPELEPAAAADPELGDGCGTDEQPF